MNCDLIAPFYALLETLAFGSKLQDHRLTYLDAAAGKRRALVLGDGDGRFTQGLLARFPELEVDFLDISEGMIRQARKRLAGAQTLRIIQADATTYVFADERYEIVFTHFFLDCFDTETAARLIASVSTTLPDDAVWVVSEFRQGERGWRRLFTAAWLFTMYAFFRIATGLRNSRIPEYGPALEQCGFRLTDQRLGMLGLINSQLWRRHWSGVSFM